MFWPRKPYHILYESMPHPDRTARLCWRGVAWRGVAWRGVAWRGVAWRGVARSGVAWRGAARRVLVCLCGPPLAPVAKTDVEDSLPTRGWLHEKDTSVPEGMDKAHPEKSMVDAGPAMKYG